MVACCSDYQNFACMDIMFKACGKMVHRWATHNCPLTIHKTYYQLSTFCMKLAKLHLLKSGRASGQMATPHGRLLTIFFVCRFLLLYFEDKTYCGFSKNILKSGRAGGQMSHRWATHGWLLTICGRETLQFHFLNRLFFGWTRFCLTSGNTEHGVGTLESKEGLGNK